WVQVNAIQAWSQSATVHNLTVQGVHTYHVATKSLDVLNHNCDGQVDWVQENASKDANAQACEDGAIGARSRISSGLREVPALDYIDLKGETRAVKFDGFDEANGVMIDRKVGVAATDKTRGAIIRQSLALE
ncbi:hypothetical protein, partial [Nocardiopsis flavescens]|uniref:hypothetical protein n=1 Tax=Nocardiopsis flavescens TaxID=758803 RepID=UPI001C49D763